MGPNGTGGEAGGIGAVRQAWLDALARGDLDALVGMVTEDAVFLPPNSDPVQGREGVREMYARLMARFRLRQDVTVSETRIEGDLAYEWGGQTLVMTPRRGGPPVTVRGCGLAIYRREADGAWRCARAISNLGPARSST